MKTSTSAHRAGHATQHFAPDPIDNTRLANLCGPLDENLRQIAAALDVTIFRRGERFIADGAQAARAVEMLARFYDEADKPISVEDIQLALVEQRAAQAGTGEKPAILAKKGEEAEAECGPQFLGGSLLFVKVLEDVAGHDRETLNGGKINRSA